MSGTGNTQSKMSLDELLKTFPKKITPAKRAKKEIPTEVDYNRLSLASRLYFDSMTAKKEATKAHRLSLQRAKEERIGKYTGPIVITDLRKERANNS